METVRLPYPGDLLVSHLTAFGIAVALDAADIDAYVRHDPDSLSFEPIVEYRAGVEDVVDAIRRSAVEAEAVVEADVEPGKTGNDRRPMIWARASFANDAGRAATVLAGRQQLVDAAQADRAQLVAGLLSGLGAPVAWGTERLKPSSGATALDGVLGNNTSDLVRGVLRPARLAATAAEEEILGHERSTQQLDKTGWAPPGTPVDLAHQWLAVLGLSLLPVVHRPFDPSVTPACWDVKSPRRRGITLPLLTRSTTVDRLRALLALGALARLADHDPTSKAGMAAAAEIRSFGIIEAVAFERLAKRGSGTSVAFSFRRGRRLALT